MAQVIVRLNSLANACASVCFAPIARVPGWLSATTIGVVTGVVMLVVFKYTSRQAAITRTRSQIKANLLALSLFKDNVGVGLRAQARILVAAGRLLLLSLVPMVVMTVPMVLLLGQMALWYQARPLQVGEEAVVTVQVASHAAQVLEKTQLRLTPQVQATIGPVRVPTKDMVCWSIKPTAEGLQELIVDIGDQSFAKQLAVGDGFMPISLKRPSLRWIDVLLHPRETPFAEDSMVQSIEVAFPERHAWTSGSRTWLIYWFAISMVAAFAAKPWLKVSI